MERLCGARAMEWSIELEIGLRSNDPNQRICTIEKIGSRLHEWSLEADMTKAVTDLYGLVPGEDRLFANTILLRLADAFRTGDNRTRKSILKVFLLEVKHLRKKGKLYGGILAKQRVPNHVELLKRVKIVFDMGDTEAKCLALRLFGCWADFAKDSTHIRYIVLSSLRSSQRLEVKASIFAAGCFCWLSEDFACICLEILVYLISSQNASAGVRLAAIRVLPKMRSSVFVQRRAYQAGEKLVSSCQQDLFLEALLLALTKLVLSSSVLTTKQVNLLQQCLFLESSPPIKITVLKCLNFLLVRGTYNLYLKANLVAELFAITDDDSLSVDFHCEALKILCKISSTPITSPCMGTPELLKLVNVLGIAAQSSIKRKRNIACSLLSDILCLKMEKRAPLCLVLAKCLSRFSHLEACSQCITSVPGGADLTCLFCHFTVLLINQVDTMLKLVDFKSCEELGSIPRSYCSLSEMKDECHSFTRLIIPLAREHPSAAIQALNRSRDMIQFAVGMYERFNLEDSDSQVEGSTTSQGNTPFKPDSMENGNVWLELLLCFCKVATACLLILDEASMVSCEICHTVKLLVEFLGKSSVCAAYEAFCLMVQVCVVYYSCNIEMKSTQDKDVCGLESSSHILGVVPEGLALGLTKKMVQQRNYWDAYRAAKYCCSKGLWFAAAFAFRKLINSVQSNPYRCWLKSLTLLTGCESEIKLMLFPNVGIELIKELQADSRAVKPLGPFEEEAGLHIDENAVLSCFNNNLLKVSNRVQSAEYILSSLSHSGGIYYFQRWFLYLRSKVLEVLTDMLSLLASCNVADKVLNEPVIGNQGISFTNILERMQFIVARLFSMSCRLHKLAKSYDLLATSFSTIDSESNMIISVLSLNCLLLAFCSTFTFCSCGLPSNFEESFGSLKELEKPSASLILKDLVWRLKSMDSTSLVELQQLASSYGVVIDNLPNETQINSSRQLQRASSVTFRFSVSAVLSIQQDLKGVKDEKDLENIFGRGLKVLLDFIIKWMKMPSPIPRFFFTVRPCFGAELYAANMDTNRNCELSVSHGTYLSLNLCMQLKSIPAGLLTRIEKMYCVLAVRQSECSPLGVGEKGQTGWKFEPSKTDELVEMNDLLSQYIASDISKASSTFCESNLVTAFACFEPNSKGQGFSSSLLNVTAFPQGLYQIKWHSCCFGSSGQFWNLLPLNSGPVFRVQKP